MAADAPDVRTLEVRGWLLRASEGLRAGRHDLMAVPPLLHCPTSIGSLNVGAAVLTAAWPGNDDLWGSGAGEGLHGHLPQKCATIAP